MLTSFTSSVIVQLPFSRLSGMLEVADDMALDIPMFWDYFAACVSPMVVEGSFSLSTFAELANKATTKAPKCVARVMVHCAKQSSTERATELWTRADLRWTSLGLEESAVTEFVNAEVCCMYLCCALGAGLCCVHLRQYLSLVPHPSVTVCDRTCSNRACCTGQCGCIGTIV